MSGANEVSVMKDWGITLENMPLKATALHSVNMKFFSFSSIKNKHG